MLVLTAFPFDPRREPSMTRFRNADRWSQLKRNPPKADYLECGFAASGLRFTLMPDLALRLLMLRYHARPLGD
jgi:hypothetical protein